MDYKPNSNRFKEQQKVASEEKKKVEKVVTGKVKTKNKTGLQKFTSAFIAEDIDNVKSYIITEVVIPAITDTLSDILKKSVDAIFGKGSSKSSSSRASKISYRSYYDDPKERTSYGNKNRIGYDFDDIVIDDRGEAEEVLERMDELISAYGLASVADFYDLVGITAKYTDNNYGWTDIRNAKVVRVSDGYMIKLPRALPLN